MASDVPPPSPSPLQDLDASPPEPFFGNHVAVRDKTILTVLMMVFFSIYMCSEFAIFSFLPAFGGKAGIDLPHSCNTNACKCFIGVVFGSM